MVQVSRPEVGILHIICVERGMSGNGSLVRRNQRLIVLVTMRHRIVEYYALFSTVSSAASTECLIKFTFSLAIIIGQSVSAVVTAYSTLIRMQRGERTSK